MPKLGQNTRHSNKSAGCVAQKGRMREQAKYSDNTPFDHLPGPKFHKTMIKSSNTQTVRKTSSLPRAFPTQHMKVVTSPAGRKRGK